MIHKPLLLLYKLQFCCISFLKSTNGEISRCLECLVVDNGYYVYVHFLKPDNHNVHVLYLRVFPQVTSMPYDERPLPALRKRSGEQLQPQLNHLPGPVDPSTPRSPGGTGEPEPLSEKAQREASVPIEVYGDSLVRNLIFPKKYLSLN